MIIIYECDEYCDDILYFFAKTKYLKFTFLYKFNKKLFDEAEVIIPMGLKTQKELNKYPEYSHKFLISKKNIYSRLNDKIKFYNLIKKHNILENSEIKLINSYDYNNSPDIYGKFILKKRGGCGSMGNIIEIGKLKKIIEKYDTSFQIQDFIDIDHVNGINCVCKDGEIISALNFITPHAIQADYYDKNNRQYICPVDHIFTKVVSDIVKTVNYSGLIEIEFITDVDGINYLMECNPRLSGNIKCITRNKQCPYIDNLIVAYYNTISKSKIKKTNYNEIQKITYIGDINDSSYDTYRYSNGIVTLEFLKY